MGGIDRTRKLEGDASCARCGLRISVSHRLNSTLDAETAMDASSLSQHPIFSAPDNSEHPGASSLPSASGPRRRNVVAIRGSDVILACGKELRIGSLADAGSQPTSFKVNTWGSFRGSLVTELTEWLTGL